MQEKFDDGHRVGYAFHLSGVQFGAIQGTPDSTPPTVVVQNSNGEAVQDGGFVGQTITVQVSDSGSGVDYLEVTKGGTFVDRETNLANGTASFVFSDPTFYGPSNIYTVDLSSLKNGDQIFVRTFDAAGNESPIQRFTIDLGPRVSIKDNGVVDQTFNLYEGFTGSSPGVPSSVVPSYPGGQALFLVDADQGNDIASLSVVDAGGNPVPVTLTAGGPLHQTGRIGPSPLPPGVYTLTATDINGQKTIAPFEVARLDAVYDPASTVVPNPDGTYTYDTIFDLVSSKGLAKADRIDDSNIQILGTTPLSGNSATLSAAGVTPPNPFFNVYDVDGNSIHAFARFAPGPSGSNVTLQIGPYEGTLFDTGSYAGATPLGFGAEVSNLVALAPAAIDATLSSTPRLESGYRAAPSSALYVFHLEFGPQGFGSGGPSGPPFAKPGYTLTLPFDPTGLSAGQIQNSRVVPIDFANNIGRPVAAAVAGSQIDVTGDTTFTQSHFPVLPARYAIEVPAYSNPGVLNIAGASLLYDASVDGPITMTRADPVLDATAAHLLALASAQGLSLQSELFLLGPEGAVFKSPAYLTLPAQSQGTSLVMVQLSPGLTPQILPGQFSSYQYPAYSALIPSINSYFGVFKFVDPGPVTTLFIDGVAVSSPSVVAHSTDVFSLSATGVIGVAQTLYLVDVTTTSCQGVAANPSAPPGTCANPNYAGPFSLAAGAHTIYFQSVDVKGVSEPIKSILVNVGGAGPSPPFVALLSPSSSSQGLDRVFGRSMVPVIGTVRDTQLASYTLAVASGADATGGFATIASSNVAVSSAPLASWDTRALSGFYTLRLSAANAAGGSAVASATVYIGEPALELALVNPGERREGRLKDPAGVAVGANGRLFVANGGRDEILVFDSTGTLLASYDGATRLSRDRVLRFERPDGLAIDASGRLYAADRGHHRVAVLSSTGAVIYSLGRRGPQGFLPGDGPGEFDRPAGVAVSSDRLAVADPGNGRVEVFDLSGNFLFQIRPGVEAREAKPAGVAWDAQDGLYVSEETSDRVLAYDPQGNFRFALGRRGSAPGQWRDPQGLALSPSGFFYGVDAGNERAQKADPFRNFVLAFGRRFDLERPDGLALDPGGALYATDPGRQAVLKFVLPDGVPPRIVTVPPAKNARLILDIAGGGIAREDGAKVELPAGALPAPLEVTIAQERKDDPAEEAFKRGRLADKKLVEASEGVEYGPEGTTFSVPVLVTVPYAPSLMPQDAHESDLKVHYWNPRTLDWDALPSSVNASNRTVSAFTNHFSLYKVLAPSRPQAAPGAATFQWGDVYAYPNPARGGTKPVFHVEAGLADSIEIKVYSVSGERVLDTTLAASPAWIGGRYAYEYVWDGHIASGVYLFSVTAVKDGARLVKTGRLAVVR